MGNIVASGASVVAKVGEGINARVSGAEWIQEQFITQAESYVNVLTRTNYSDSFAGLDTDVSGILIEAVENLAAIYAITYDMSGYTTRIEAENKINVLWARFNQCVKLLTDQKSVSFINGA